MHFLLSLQEDILTIAAYISKVYQGDLKRKLNLGYPPTRTLESLSNRPVTVALLNQTSSSVSHHSD